MPSFLLLLHENPADSAALSAAEMQAIIQAHQAWAERLAQAGHLLGGEKLTDDGGRRLRFEGDRPVVSDGPYAEAHDVIGGYYLLQAPDMATAEALAQGCPHRLPGSWIDIREVEQLG